MTEKKKRTKAGPAGSKLPPAGLAADVLGKGALEDLEKTDDSPVPSTGPERIYDFADSLDNAGGDGAEKAEILETWVSFELADEVFALPVTHVQEILRVDSITAVPHAPKPVRGVTNKRGRVLPVVDLRVRLGLPEAEIGNRSRILVVESRGRLLGLLVDAVQQVVRIAPSKVQPPPPDVMTDQSDYILGVYNFEGALAILLEVERVLVIQESISN